MGSKNPPAGRSEGNEIRNAAGESVLAPQTPPPRSKTLHHFPAPPAQENPGERISTVQPSEERRSDTAYSIIPEPEIVEVRRPPSSPVPPGEQSRKELKEEVKRLSQHNLRLGHQMLFLASVLESTSDAMIVADNDGRITIFNSGACELFQVTAADAKDDNLFRLLADNAPDGKLVAEMLMRNQSIANLRTEVVGFEGRRVPVLLTLNFIKESGEKPSIVAVLKDNSEVESLTRTDPLTGIANRREFDRKVADEHCRMKRGHSSPLSLLFLDVDHFGDFNKKYGHQVGDEVLRKVGAVLRKTVRNIDTPARYGGEEFVVILPGTDEKGAWLLAERVRRVLAAVSVHVEGIGDLRVTASVGVSTHRQEDGGVTEIISEANQAMLVAKRTGRNRTCSFREQAA
jgi:diguanylate cyclase (GGDEF)-like protein/PAS domain S-box-containing protein